MIPGLDGLRAIAVLMVFFFHEEHLPIGWMGVQLFFVLSGFLITDILLRMKDKLPRREFFIKFYGRRFLRIFPLYYFYLLCLLALIVFAPALKLQALYPQLGPKFINQLWAAALYAYDFFHASSWYEPSRFFTHLWSLAVEEQFYLVWPLLIFLTPREKLKTLFFAGVGLGFIFRLVITLVYRGQILDYYLLDDPQRAVYVLPFSHLDAFAFGAYISRFEIPRPRLQLFITLAVICAVGVYFDLDRKGALTSALSYDFPMRGLYREVWGYTLLNYFLMLLIYCVARTNFLTPVLESFPLRYLGKISYGFYIYHFGVPTLLVVICRTYNLDYSPNPFISVLIVSSLSYYLLEKPILDLKDKFFRI